MSEGRIVASVALFAAAGLCEIGGGWLVWRWWRDGASAAGGVVGAALLVLYGVVATYQPAPFGRTYAAYGGVFIAMAVVWGAAVSATVPDRYDVAGAVLCLLGAAVMMYARR